MILDDFLLKNCLVIEKKSMKIGRFVVKELENCGKSVYFLSSDGETENYIIWRDRWYEKDWVDYKRLNEKLKREIKKKLKDYIICEVKEIK